MNDFFDTSVLVSSLMESHPHYHPARRTIDVSASEGRTGFIGLHSLAETFTSLTRLPVQPRVAPGEAVQLIKSVIIPRFRIVTLDPKDYEHVLESLASRKNVGAQIYDALLLQCAVKCAADRIFTFNLGHFTALAPQQLAGRIVVPVI